MSASNQRDTKSLDIKGELYVFVETFSSGLHLPPEAYLESHFLFTVKTKELPQGRKPGHKCIKQIISETCAPTSKTRPKTVVIAIEEAVQNPGENCGVVFLLICILTGADNAKQPMFYSKPNKSSDQQQRVARTHPDV